MIDHHIIAGIKELERDGSPGLLLELVGLFARRTPELIGQIEEGLAANDSAAIARAGHVLKSSCGNLGAMTLSQLGAELEARAAVPAEVRRLLECFKREFQVVVVELKAECGA